MVGMEELFRVYHLLACSPRYGISRTEFLGALGIRVGRDDALSPSQEQEFERAKKALRDAGIPLVNTETGGYRLQVGPNPLTRWDMTVEDYRVLDTLCKGWYGTDLEDSARRILRKVAASVPNLQHVKKLHSHAEPLTRIRFQDDPYLEEIFSALAEHKNVSVSYQNYSGARRQSTLSVWGVGHRYGNWYFVGFDSSKAQPRAQQQGFTYRLSRMGSLTVLKTGPKAFTAAPAQFSMADSLDRLGQWQNSTLTVEDARTGQQFTVPSYGTVETATDAISNGWRIPHAEDNEHQRTVRQVQQRILRELQQAHEHPAKTPSGWKKNTTRDRPDAVDKLIDALLALHYVQATGEQSLKTIGAALAVDTGKPKKLLDAFRAVEAHYDRHVPEDSLPFERGFDDPQTNHKGAHLVEYLPLEAGHQLYAGVAFSDVELALLVFSLDAAQHILGRSKQLSRLRDTIANSYGDRAGELSRALSFRPDAPWRTEILEALASSRALRIRYGDQDFERVIDPYGLVFMYNQFYLYAFCRTSAGRVGQRDAWRNFRLSSITHLEDAGPAHPRTPPAHAHTPEQWSRAQQFDEDNPFALLRVRVEALGSPGSSAVKEACRRLLRVSSHAVALDAAKPNSPKVFHRVHYFPGERRQGMRRILDTVIDGGGALELLGPQQLRAELLERIDVLMVEEGSPDAES